MLTSIRAALAITLAVLPGMGFAQVKADEPKWVEFQGEYRNLAGYAYHVVVPPGFTGHEAPAPAPAHGFGVDLESAANAYIWVDGSYNVVVYPSAHSATQEHLKWFKEEHTVIGRPVLRQSKMASLPASELLVRYRKGKDGEARVMEEIVAIRNSDPNVGIVYTIRLDTTATRFEKDRQIFLALLRTFEFDRNSQTNRPRSTFCGGALQNFPWIAAPNRDCLDQSNVPNSP